jgi:hypothetical protein
MPPLLLWSEPLDDEPLMPLPRLISGLFELLELPLLLDEEPFMPPFELPLLPPPLVAELPMPLEPEVLPVLPTLERSVFRVLPTLLDAPKPLSLLLLEPLPEFDELLSNPLRSELLEDESLVFRSELLFERSDICDPPTAVIRRRPARSIHAGKAIARDRTPSATSRV